ncbi:AI-2E family transporter [Candidatus Woesearchaeota archaeon]|nr:AI-2E family transporter [Candidatus Woesearchaeota archaeon]
MKLSEKRNFFVWFILFISLLLIIGLWDFIPFILTGLILAYVFFPLFNWTSRKIKNDLVSAGITVAVSLLIVVVPIMIISSILVVQSGEAVNYIENTKIIPKITEFISAPENFQPYLGGEDLQNSLKGIAEKAVSLVTGYIPSFINFLSNFVLGVFISFVVLFFALIDRGNFLKFVESFIPVSEKAKKRIQDEGETVIKTVVYGMFLVALIQGAAGGIGFFIFGVKGAALWGLIMAFAAIIPVLGAFLVWLPVSIYLFASGDTYGGIGLFLYGAIVVSYIDNIARMKIFNSLGKIHPLVTLFGLLIGLPFFGAIGVIIGPLIIALFMTVLKIVHEEK